MYLHEYRQGVGALRGVGPVLERALGRLGIHTLDELLRHYPRDYQDRRRPDELAAAAGREWANVAVRVTSRAWIGRGYRKSLKVLVEDASGRAALLCFGRP